MLKVGITGGIGSGKSTVCNILKNLGVPVFTSDEVGRYLLNNDVHLKKQVKETFDSDMYTSSGELDRERMARLVFNNPEELEKLNSMVHPRVKAEFDSWCKKNEKRAYVVKEAAILFESGQYQDLDKVVTVFCPKDIRIERVKNRDGVSVEQIEGRMMHQISDEERNELSDFIVVNDGKEELLPQVMELHELFLNEDTKTKSLF